ncbi:hypothetical protein AC1031_019362 [Aphanomyces cochlioides]|nr:hypothetical protein AC1031_019362 [Aphanomyces cochlioides]
MGGERRHPTIKDVSAGNIQMLREDVMRLVSEGLVKLETDANASYERQGNMAFYSKENLALRLGIRNHPLLKRLTCALWRLVCKTDQPMNFDGYHELMIRLHKILMEHFNASDSFVQIQEDWASDAKTHEILTYENFHLAIFELVDLWCDSINVNDYISLLYLILEGITRIENARFALRPLEEILYTDVVDVSLQRSIEDIESIMSSMSEDPVTPPVVQVPLPEKRIKAKSQPLPPPNTPNLPLSPVVAPPASPKAPLPAAVATTEANMADTPSPPLLPPSKRIHCLKSRLTPIVYSTMPTTPDNELNHLPRLQSSSSNTHLPLVATPPNVNTNNHATTSSLIPPSEDVPPSLPSTAQYKINILPPIATPAPSSKQVPIKVSPTRLPEVATSVEPPSPQRVTVPPKPVKETVPLERRDFGGFSILSPKDLLPPASVKYSVSHAYRGPETAPMGVNLTHAIAQLGEDHRAGLRHALLERNHHAVYRKTPPKLVIMDAKPSSVTSDISSESSVDPPGKALVRKSIDFQKESIELVTELASSVLGVTSGSPTRRKSQEQIRRISKDSVGIPPGTPDRQELSLVAHGAANTWGKAAVNVNNTDSTLGRLPEDVAAYWSRPQGTPKHFLPRSLRHKHKRLLDATSTPTHLRDTPSDLIRIETLSAQRAQRQSTSESPRPSRMILPPEPIRPSPPSPLISPNLSIDTAQMTKHDEARVPLPPSAQRPRLLDTAGSKNRSSAIPPRGIKPLLNRPVVNLQDAPPTNLSVGATRLGSSNGDTASLPPDNQTRPLKKAKAKKAKRFEEPKFNIVAKPPAQRVATKRQ